MTRPGSTPPGCPSNLRPRIESCSRSACCFRRLASTRNRSFRSPYIRGTCGVSRRSIEDSGLPGPPPVSADTRQSSRKRLPALSPVRIHPRPPDPAPSPGRPTFSIPDFGHFRSVRQRTRRLGGALAPTRRARAPFLEQACRARPTRRSLEPSRRKPLSETWLNCEDPGCARRPVYSCSPPRRSGRRWNPDWFDE